MIKSWVRSLFKFFKKMSVLEDYLPKNPPKPSSTSSTSPSVSSGTKLLYKGFIAFAFSQEISPKLINLGYKVSASLLGVQTKSVGSQTNPIYPDIVVYRPGEMDFKTAKFKEDTAVLAGLVETQDSLKSPDIVKWDILSSLKIVFQLIVPKESVDQVKSWIERFNLKNIMLISYTFNSATAKYAFQEEA